MQLTKESIIAASLEILSEYGLADMTMRRLAAHLNVAPGAMYWHFKNKQALIDATARAVLQPLFDAPTATLAQACMRLREAMFSYRDGAELLSAALANPALRAEMEAVLAASARSDGLPRPDLAAATLLSFVLGSSMMDQAALQQAELQEITVAGTGDTIRTLGVDSDNFTDGLDAVIAGMSN